MTKPTVSDSTAVLSVIPEDEERDVNGESPGHPAPVTLMKAAAEAARESIPESSIPQEHLDVFRRQLASFEKSYPVIVLHPPVCKRLTIAWFSAMPKDFREVLLAECLTLVEDKKLRVKFTNETGVRNFAARAPFDIPETVFNLTEDPKLQVQAMRLWEIAESTRFTMEWNQTQRAAASYGGTHYVQEKRAIPKW